jgi:hypothetical protein
MADFFFPFKLDEAFMHLRARHAAIVQNRGEINAIEPFLIPTETKPNFRSDIGDTLAVVDVGYADEIECVG